MNKIFLAMFVLFVLGGVSAGAFSVDSNTVALWHFDEAAGNTTFDQTSNHNDGTIIGASWTNDSKFGSALEFNGIDNKVQITKTPSVDITDKITLEAYVKIKSNSDGTVISKNGPYFLAIRNNVVMGGIYANNGIPGSNTWTEVHGTTSLALDTWYYLKLIYDGNNISIYLNDALENSVTKSGQMPQVSQQINIGWGEPGQNQFFNGTIDEVRISNATRFPTLNPQPSLEDRVAILEGKVVDLENKVDNLEHRTSLLEDIVQKIVKLIKHFPKGLVKDWDD